jgi:hypothetical protein
MKLLTILAASVLSLPTAGLLGAGCSSGTAAECTSLCEAEQKCAGVTTDCASACAEADTLASTTGCTGPYDDWVSCEDGLSSLCDPNPDDPPCTTQSNALNACVGVYCKANPTSTYCPDKPGS